MKEHYMVIKFKNIDMDAKEFEMYILDTLEHSGIIDVDIKEHSYSKC